jgi:tetratricopeptide (TPR) repeat protein
MSSIIEGYNYDIFISYRQKDNKGDRWVSEFVDALKDELESTFKEEISVYFDVNPIDGLLDTHDVEESLKDKLKCLVFIPIISRTYCDPEAFAWEHEFSAFIKLASNDKFGLKVKLPGGNVTNRVLPVRIHDLDYEDLRLCESTIGSVLRGIEFIYKEPGVNRPLSPDDDEKINLNKTRYRNQINKVALAIKDIILGLKIEPTAPIEEITELRESAEIVIREEKRVDLVTQFILSKRRLFSGIAIIAILIVASIFAYPKVFKKDRLGFLRSQGDISVAVMPFQNMTNDTIWNVWQDGIQNELINNLSNSEELKVRQLESITDLLQSKGFINYASIVPSVARKISLQLDANVFINGSIKQAGSVMRVNAQLIDSKTEEVYKSFQIDGTAENILNITDSLSRMVKNFLIISKLEQELPLYLQYSSSTNSSEAYRYYIYGENARRERDYPTARNMFSQALAIDSNFTIATLMLSVACTNQGLYEEAKKWSQRAYEKRDQMPTRVKILIDKNHAFFFDTPYEEIKYIRQLLEFDDQYPYFYYNLGLKYNTLYQYDKAIPEFEKALEIYDKWDLKPWWIYNYTLLGDAYHETGQYKKEKKLYKKAEKDFPNDAFLVHKKAVLSLTEGDTIAANEYINKYISLRRENSWSEADIAYNLGEIYSVTGNLDKAEKYHRQELSFEPDEAVRNYNLGWFLVDKNRNIDEGLELIDKALKLRPDQQWYFLVGKGWGLYKQSKYKEALEVLEKSRDLTPYYRHTLYLYIEAAKKAIANQKDI